MNNEQNLEPKTTIKALRLNIKTISILDDMALQNIKGGRLLEASESSCTSGHCHNSCKHVSPGLED